MSPPTWPEISVKAIWPEIESDKEIMQYFPERIPESTKLPSREFMWGVLYTLRPNYCEALIKEAMTIRS